MSGTTTTAMIIGALTLATIAHDRITTLELW